MSLARKLLRGAAIAGGGGGFPQVAAVNTTAHGASTTYTVNLPTGIAAGNLLLVVVGHTSATATYPAGWTEFSGWDGNQWSGAYRFADGSEGATISVTISTFSAGQSWSMRITGAHASIPPEAGVETTLAAVAPDPPSLSPSWGALNTLWIAAMFSNSNGQTVTAYPTNYNSNQTNLGSTNRLAYATRELNAASDNPGIFTTGFPTVFSNSAQTIAIRPT